MPWQFWFFAFMFTVFVWHIVSDTGDNDHDDGCALCDARVMHTHNPNERR